MHAHSVARTQDEEDRAIHAGIAASLGAAPPEADADIVAAALRKRLAKSEGEKARHNAMVEEHNGLANSHREAWCCVHKAALRRGPELDSEKSLQLEQGTYVEARRSPLPT